ncbi:hypothetical protein GCM10029992_56800 [Glycomyces albus]
MGLAPCLGTVGFTSQPRPSSRGAGVAERCALIEAEKANYAVKWMCALLSVPRSTFYYWRDQAETATEARRRRLAVEIERVFQDSRRAYGCRRVAAQLNREGIACSVGLVADLMREAGLEAVQPRAWKKTTIPGEVAEAVADHVGRDCTARAPGRVAVGDITYLKTGEGWLYLATVIDLHTRMVIGWQMADHMRTSLVIEALAAAKEAGYLDQGAVFHSDRGTQAVFKRRPSPPGARPTASIVRWAVPACAGTMPQLSRSSRA